MIIDTDEIATDLMNDTDFEHYSSEQIEEIAEKVCADLENDVELDSLYRELLSYYTEKYVNSEGEE